MGTWKKGVVGTLVTMVVALDIFTKSWAMTALGDRRTIELLGGLVPLTLAFNRGAAFGLRIGSNPRWVFIPVTLVAVAFLLVLIRQTSRGEHLRLVAASLILGGALGNLYDRLRWDRGVVDFIGPIDLGFMLWPIFNAADSAITTGALLLALTFWLDDSNPQRRVATVGRAEGAPMDGGPAQPG
ncbi:MAG: signal peptidase II [Gemmatimonadetes bacterium]|nr:signal peptidase II [Gemmatimonadota bacterium]